MTSITLQGVEVRIARRKVDAQYVATARATYFSNSNLADTVATAYGFNLPTRALAQRSSDVGSQRRCFGVADSTYLTIMQLPLASDDLIDEPDSLTGAASIYDTNGDGVIDDFEAAMRVQANNMYTAINEGGDI
jgi:hypothetical protein